MNFPNYYGYQRFGINRVNHLIGKALLKNNLDVLKNLFADHSSVYNLSYKNILHKFSKPLIKFYINAYQSYLFNRVLSNRILDNYPLDKCVSSDYCTLNETVKRIFICREKLCRGNPVIPLIGYSYLPKNRLSDKYYTELLKEEDVKPRDFYLNFKGLKFFGGFRFTSLNIKNLYVVMGEDKENVSINFFMNRGMYATIFLRELIKPQFPSKYGF